MELRPLRFGEILDAAFRLYRRRWLACFTRSLIVMIPTWLAISFLALTLSGTDENRTSEIFFLAQGIPVSVVTSLMMLLYLNAVALTTAWCTGRLSCAFMEYEPTADRTYLRTVPYRTVTAWTLGLILSAVTAGTPLMSLLLVKLFNDNRVPLILIMPMLWLAMIALFSFLTLALPAAMVERIGVIPALVRSLRLSARRYGGTLLMILSVYLVLTITTQGTSLFTTLVGIPADVDSESVAALAYLTVWCFWGAFIIPFIPALFTVWYFVVRIRHEGLDLAAAATAVGTARKREVAA